MLRLGFKRLSARRHAAQVDRTKHLVIEAGHPSPLNRLRDFRGTRPFSRANAWLKEKGLDTGNVGLADSGRGVPLPHLEEMKSALPQIEWIA